MTNLVKLLAVITVKVVASCKADLPPINLFITVGVICILNSKSGIFCKSGGSFIIEGSLNT